MPVSEHMFHLADTGTVLGPPLSFDNGLASVLPGGIVVFTGISSGPVLVAVDARNAQLGTPDAGAWDEIVEVSVRAPAGRMVVSSLFTDAPELPVLTTAGPGDYRVRLHARGRDTAVDLGVTEPVEEYLVIAWPSQPMPETVIKRTDAYGDRLRQPRRRQPQAVPPAPGQTTQRDRLRARLQAEEDTFRQRG